MLIASVIVINLKIFFFFFVITIPGGRAGSLHGIMVPLSVSVLLNFTGSAVPRMVSVARRQLYRSEGSLFLAAAHLRAWHDIESNGFLGIKEPRASRHPAATPATAPVLFY